MNLSDLEAFVALAEAGSIKRAAIRLGLTQPATTRRVQNFEATMADVVLLDRRVKPAALTQAGRDVLNRCQRILRAVSDLDEFMSGKSMPAGELRVGVSPGLAGVVLSSPFDELHQRFPDLQLRIASQWSGEMIEAIDVGALDCGAALLTDFHRLPPGIACAQVGIEPLAVVASHDLVVPTFSKRSKRSLRLKDLGNAGWILNPVGCGYREALMRAYDRTGAACKIVADVLGYDLQLGLVAKGVALGLVPHRLIGKSPLRRRLSTLDVVDFKLDARVMVLRGPTLGRLGAVVDDLQARLCDMIKHKSIA
jgi:DNA-binding transcriptional LysR family regulator